MGKTRADNVTDEFLKGVLDNYRSADSVWSPVYTEFKEDIEFAYDVGDGQWNANDKSKRLEEGRPCFTMNKLQKFIRKLRGEGRINRPSMKVVPVDDKGDIKTAELYNGLLRQIEHLSTADIVYDNAYKYATSGGIGFWRIVTDYAGPDTFDQEIRLKRIIDPTSVRIDPNAVEYNLEDAMYCFIEELITKDEYERQWPDSDLTSFEAGAGELFGDWLYEDKIRVAEYFWKEPEEATLVMLDDGQTYTLGVNATREAIKDAGLKIVKERQVTEWKVKWCKTNGFEVLEEGEWPGKYIPIIPVLGDEIVIRGKRYYLSMIRGAKGPQRMYNYFSVAAVENVAQTPKTPFIIDHRQIQGFEDEWDTANVMARPYLRYKHIPGLGKPERETQVTVPTGIMALLQGISFDIEDHLGQYQAAKGMAGNERTGRAILARVEQSDRTNFTFVDNLTRAIVFSCKQVVDLIPKIYDTSRAVSVMDEAGNVESVRINQSGTSPQGEPELRNDLSIGKYDLVSIAGPSFDSRRKEMVVMLMESMQYAPHLAGVIAPLIFKYSDFPDSEAIASALEAESERLKQAEGGQNVQAKGKPPQQLTP